MEAEPNRRCCLAAVLVCAALTLPLLAASQEPGPAQAKVSRETIRTTVRRVIVDVAVTDFRGKPVPALTAKDFSVYEDGVAQKILSFDSHSSASEREFVPPRLPALPTNWYVNLPSGPERGPLYVILLDLLHTDTDDQPRVRKQLQAFLRNKPEGARFAIFALTDTLHLVQGFTRDRNRLLAAVSPRSSRLPRIFLYANNFRDSVSGIGALMDIGRFLAGFPGRKNLIWIAGDFPYITILRAIPGPSSALLETDTEDSTVKGVIDALARAQVAVYPVDAHGLVVYGDLQALNGYQMLEDSIAEETGGRAFYNDNHLEGFLAEVADTGANYYELTYSPTNLKDDAKLRHIKVKISRTGLHLAHRRSYSMKALDESLPTANKNEQELLALFGVIQPDDSLYVYMQHGAPVAHGLVFAAHVQRVGEAHQPTAVQISALAQQPAYFQGEGKKPDWRLSKTSLETYSVSFRITAGQLGFRHNTAGGETTTLELALAAFDENGVMLNSVVQKADASLPPAQKQEAQVFTLQEQIDVPAEGAWLRFAVRDDSTGRIGATEIPLPLAVEAARQKPPVSK